VNVEHYRDRLLELERQLAARVGDERETARDEHDDQSAAGDFARIDELKDEYFTLADSDADVLTQVRAALQRIEDGTYGKCLVDGGPIELQRLESVPWAPYCLKHQRELEKRAQIRTPSL
jgi:RNA polymerase-binding transcription factor